MASGTKIVFSFGNASGNTINYSYNYGNDDASSASVKNAMNTMISNGSIFKRVPVSIKSAKSVITTESAFDLS